jgi:hypothetical protein
MKNFTSKIGSNFVKSWAMAKWHTMLVVHGQTGSPMMLGEERTPKQEDMVGFALADAREHSGKFNSDTPGGNCDPLSEMIRGFASRILRRSLQRHRLCNAARSCRMTTEFR